MRALLTLLVGLVVLHTATAQTATDPNEGSRLTYDSLLGTYDFSWWGQPGRTYFIQHSDDLSTWEYLPLIESGTDGLLSWGFSSTASKFFLRLRTTDIPTSDAFNADFDGDKVSNFDELLFGTDPLVSLDSDLDGLPDDWEKWHLGNLDSGAADDPDGDGLSNLEEFAQNTNPNSPDSDFDGLGDGDEVHSHGTDPLQWDSDGDTLPDGWEIQYSLNPLSPTDASQTAAGGGMTNLQHFELGSNPNDPPPPPTITLLTATPNQSADTLLYPAEDSQLLIKNGNFSQPALGSAQWLPYPTGIPRWTAVSGQIVELQQIVPNLGGQYCELDAHWPAGRAHSEPSDHGIRQPVNLTRGRYLLIFDYRGREHYDPAVPAGNFTVKLKNAGSSTDVVLATESAASFAAWKRTFITFEVTGGNPNLATVPVTLLFDIADAADSYGAFIDNVMLSALPFFDSTDYSRGFDPLAEPAQTSVCQDAATATDGTKLNVNDHIVVRFADDATALMYEVVLKAGDDTKATLEVVGGMKKDTSLKITGKSFVEENPLPATVYVYLKADTTTPRHPVATLEVDVLQKVTVRLGIWRVSDSHSAGTATAFTPAQIQGIFHRVNKVFRQACVIFTGVNPDGGGLLNDVHYDLGAQDGRLDVSKEFFVPNPEVGAARAAVSAVIATMPGPEQPKANIVIVNRFAQLRTLGITPTSDSFSYICAKNLGASSNGSIELTSAHELGHQLVLSLADKTGNTIHDPGPFPTDRTIAKKYWRGLMYETHDDQKQYTEWLRGVDWRAANDVARRFKQ